MCYGRISFKPLQCFPILFPSLNLIAVWVHILEENGCSVERWRLGKPKAVRTPNNLTKAREANKPSPTCSAWNRAISLGILDRSLRRISHQDLSFHLYKIMIIPNLNPSDCENRINCWTESIWGRPLLVVIKPIFISVERWINKMFDIVLKKFQSKFTRHLFNPRNWLYGVRFLNLGYRAIFFWGTPINAQRSTTFHVGQLYWILIVRTKWERRFGYIWFQQNGTTSHTARVLMTNLQQICGHVLTQFEYLWLLPLGLP